jgi:hypothetical protein
VARAKRLRISCFMWPTISGSLNDSFLRGLPGASALGVSLPFNMLRPGTLASRPPHCARLARSLLGRDCCPFLPRRARPAGYFQCAARHNFSQDGRTVAGRRAPKRRPPLLAFVAANALSANGPLASRDSRLLEAAPRAPRRKNKLMPSSPFAFCAPPEKSPLLTAVSVFSHCERRVRFL